MLISFLDEFGHIGPFISRNHRSHNSSPVFGLAGYVLPHQNARIFATWFFQMKGQLLGTEIRNSGKHPATWEKKGIELITTKNIKKYPSIQHAMGRMINKIYKLDGKLFYYGREKYQTPAESRSGGLYKTVLGHSIRRIDQYADAKREQFMMILDQHSDRIRLLETAAKTMFGNDPARRLIEPPFQVESHLYQTAQAADWIATIVGRLMAYRVAPTQYPDWKWTEDRFGSRIDNNVTHSTLWRPPPLQPQLPIT